MWRVDRRAVGRHQQQETKSHYDRTHHNGRKNNIRDASSTYRKHPLCSYRVTTHRWVSPQDYMSCMMPLHLWLLCSMGHVCEEPRTGNFVCLNRVPPCSYNLHLVTTHFQELPSELFS